MEGGSAAKKPTFQFFPRPARSLMSKTARVHSGVARCTQASEKHRCRGRSNSINVAGPKKVFNLSRPLAAAKAERAEETI